MTMPGESEEDCVGEDEVAHVEAGQSLELESEVDGTVSATRVQVLSTVASRT